MPVTVTVKAKSIEEIKKRLKIAEGGEFHLFCTNTCYRYMDKYVPLLEGNLRTIVDISPGSITYEMPYAGYQYYGKRKDGTHVVKNYTTPGTGPYWNKRMLSAEGQNVEKELQAYIDRGGK